MPNPTLNEDRIDALVLQEFQLRTADLDGSVARIVPSFDRGRELAIPLLTDIDDRRNVATVRALHDGEPTEFDPAERVALDPFVSAWQPPRYYRPRITERSQSPPSYYRLAVTESGINDTRSESLAATPAGATGEGKSSALRLLWIGLPVGTYAGLLILIGDRGDQDPPSAVDWPLPMSRGLGVRIYDSRPTSRSLGRSYENVMRPGSAPPIVPYRADHR